MFSHVVRVTLICSAGAVLAAMPIRSASAQAMGSVRGTVVEAGSRRPVSDVQVLVVGSSLGAVTGGDGTFRLTNVPAGERVLRARRLGFQPLDRTVSVQAGQEVTVEFLLVTSPTQLEQLVITGTAGAAEKKTVANAVAKIDVAELTERQTILNVSEVL